MGCKRVAKGFVAFHHMGRKGGGGGATERKHALIPSTEFRMKGTLPPKSAVSHTMQRCCFLNGKTFPNFSGEWRNHSKLVSKKKRKKKGGGEVTEKS